MHAIRLYTFFFMDVTNMVARCFSLFSIKR